MSTLAEIRKKLLDQENRSKNTGGYADTTLFPFWNAAEGTTTTLRYLPDADSTNVYFWRERQMIKIPFSGIKGGDEHKRVTVTVPCNEMWNGEKCPIHDEIRPWFKDAAMEDLAKTYWKKRSYVFQGFVVDAPFKEENTPENPIRRFLINTEVFNIIKAALMDPEFQEMPTDYEAGTDFKIAKTTKGQYASYATSAWARRERSLNETERAALDSFGLFDLNDFLPKKPGEKELQAIFDMFEASVDGQLYDPERFGEFYKPAGFGNDNSNSTNDAGDAPAPAKSQPKSAPASKPVVADEQPAASNDASDEPKKDVKDILAAIRNRKTS